MNKRQKKKEKKKLIMMCSSLRHGCYHENKVNERMHNEYQRCYWRHNIDPEDEDIQVLIDMGIYTLEEIEEKNKERIRTWRPKQRWRQIGKVKEKNYESSNY